MADQLCDACGAPGPVQRWRIRRAAGEESVAGFLCAACAEPLEAMFKLLPAGKRGQIRRSPVVSEAEIRARRRSDGQTGA